MLNLIVKRGASANGGTEGVMLINGEKFCYTIEDENRFLEQYLPDVDMLLKHKIAGRTCIPAGRYEIKMTWSPRFNKMMPEIMDVPGYTGVRLHPANRAEELEGCIAPGFGNDVTGDDFIEQSKAAYTALMDEHIRPALNRKEQVFITIENA